LWLEREARGRRSARGVGYVFEKGLGWFDLYFFFVRGVYLAADGRAVDDCKRFAHP
jgi:hypothetical protein